MKDDPKYQENQQDSQQCWMEQNPDYWRNYRNQHPEYVKRNRFLQKDRDQKRCNRNLAKMDALTKKSHVKAGSYYIISEQEDLAKMDALSHKYLLIPISWSILAKMDAMDFYVFFLILGDKGA